MSTNQEFEISKLIELARYKKYEMSCAGFAALDKIDKLPVAQKLKTRKIAVQALSVLSDNLIQYDYFSLEERKKLQQEAGMSDAPYKGFKNLFTAPKAEEDLDEDYIPQEEEAKYDFVTDEDGEVVATAADDDDEDEDDFDDDDDLDEDDED
jgi:hypothetical protein